MSTAVYDNALILARQKIKLFKLHNNSKAPAVESFTEATNDPAKLKEIFLNSNFNSALLCGKMADGLYLVGVDVDVKDGKNGFKVLEDLDMLGFELPETWSQSTPSGGKHFLFWSPVPIKHGVDVVGIGIDLRGENGYLVAPGSSINGKPYVSDHKAIAALPQWFIDKYKKPDATVHMIRKPGTEDKPVQNQVFALTKAVEFLKSLPSAIQGSRNKECFRVVCRLKDFGIAKIQMFDLLDTFWKCDPPLEHQEIEITIDSAFKTGKSSPGSDAPENVFDIIPKEDSTTEDFVEVFNKKYFYCAANGTSRVCEEMEVDGNFHLERYAVSTFHEMLLAKSIVRTLGGEPKKVQKSKEWMKDPRRRSYKNIRFIPRPDIPKTTFNLWRGFHTEPLAPDKPRSAEAILGATNFLIHCQENICDNDDISFKWLMGFVAHMFQKPWQKPPIALVFQGEKGTGKNVFIDVLKHMIGPHSVTVSGKHSLTSNFNSMMEDKILVALDEAFWSGDKSVEGVLKSMITDTKRNIERKGEEPYSADVYDRIVIMGNEDRLVNATGDERRFAVFNIASHRRGDSDFFGTILDGIRQHGSDRLLMDYFLSLDISKFNVRKAPETQGLRDQKEHSLSPLEIWWRECLREARIVGDYNGSGTWPTHIAVKDFAAIYYRYAEENFPKSYRVSEIAIGKKFKKIAASCSSQKHVRQGHAVNRSYIFCSLEQARKEWNESLKLNEVWE